MSATAKWWTIYLAAKCGAHQVPFKFFFTFYIRVLHIYILFFIIILFIMFSVECLESIG